jgi:hypothetical protein
VPWVECPRCQFPRLRKARRDRYVEEDLHACSLLLEELAVPIFGDDLHHVILGCGLVEPMSEGFAYDRAL